MVHGVCARVCYRSCVLPKAVFSISFFFFPPLIKEDFFFSPMLLIKSPSFLFLSFLITMASLDIQIDKIDAQIAALERDRAVLKHARDEIEAYKRNAHKSVAKASLSSPAVQWLKEHGVADVAIPGGAYGHRTRLMLEETTLYELATKRFNEHFKVDARYKNPTAASFEPRLSKDKYDMLISYLNHGPDDNNDQNEEDEEDEEATISLNQFDDEDDDEAIQYLKKLQIPNVTIPASKNNPHTTLYAWATERWENGFVGQDSVLKPDLFKPRLSKTIYRRVERFLDDGGYYGVDDLDESHAPKYATTSSHDPHNPRNRKLRDHLNERARIKHEARSSSPSRR
jgi:hypothetical protein